MGIAHVACVSENKYITMEGIPPRLTYCVSQLLVITYYSRSSKVTSCSVFKCNIMRLLRNKIE